MSLFRERILGGLPGNGGGPLNFVVVSTPYTTLTTDQVIETGSTSGNITLVSPSSVPRGTVQTVTSNNGSTTTAASVLAAGLPTRSIISVNQSISYISSGTAWRFLEFDAAPFYRYISSTSTNLGALMRDNVIGLRITTGVRGRIVLPLASGARTGAVLIFIIEENSGGGFRAIEPVNIGNRTTDIILNNVGDSCSFVSNGISWFMFNYTVNTTSFSQLTSLPGIYSQQLTFNSGLTKFNGFGNSADAISTDSVVADTVNNRFNVIKFFDETNGDFYDFKFSVSAKKPPSGQLFLTYAEGAVLTPVTRFEILLDGSADTFGSANFNFVRQVPFDAAQKCAIFLEARNGNGTFSSQFGTATFEMQRFVA